MSARYCELKWHRTGPPLEVALQGMSRFDKI